MRRNHKPSWRERWIGCALLFWLAWATSLVGVAQSSAAPRLQVTGTVRNPGGESISDAVVTLQQAADNKIAQRTTDLRGAFIFDVSQPGTYQIAVEKPGWRKSDPQLISVQRGEKHIDLVLTPRQLDSAKMEFDDKPNFSIAGVTDWSGAGGHGSETGQRTTEALTSQTLALDSSTTHSGEPVTEPKATALYEQRAQIQKALEHDNRAELHRELGDIDERLNDPVAAEHEYEQATHLDPSELNYFSWGAELLLHRASSAAVEVFAKGVAAHPNSARLRAGLGAALYAAGSTEQGALRLCEASDLEPSQGQFYALMAEIEKTATSTPCIAQKLARFLALEPRNPVANYYYAITLWKQQRASSASSDLPEAEKLLEAAVGLDSHFGEAYLQLGIIREQIGDTTAAMKDFRSCISVSPKMGQCHYRLGLLYRRLGQQQQAEQEIQKYEQAQAADTAEIERRRSNLRQFLVVLKDQPSSVH